MKNTIVYIDGFNFYYGLKDISKRDKNWKKYYWLDFVLFSEKMLPQHQIVKVNYFSAKPHDIHASKRQDTLFSANKTNPKFQLVLGKYLKKEITCRNCKSIIQTFEEKETDVRIATQLVADVYKNKCDVSVIVSADSDIIPSIELIREINPNHEIYVFFPPLRHSIDLANSSNYYKKLANFESRFKQSMLPEKVVLPNGIELKRPDNWQ